MVVRFGAAPCAVTSATFDTITCVTAAAPADGFGAYPLALQPAAAAPEQAFPAATFSYTTVLTPTVTSVSPRRGSTAGGTNVTVFGSNFGADASKVTVLLGTGSSCGGVVLLNDSALQCATSGGAGLSLPPQGQLPIRVRQ